MDNDKSVLSRKVLCRKVAHLCNLAGDKQLAKKIGNCSNFIKNRKVKIKNGKYVPFEIVKISFCKDRLCPICQEINRRRLLARNKAVALNIVNANPTAKFYHITLTIKNLFDIDKNVITDLRQAFSKLTRRKDVTKTFLGCFMSVEITYSKKEGFHPHIHAIFAFKNAYSQGHNYLSGEKWLELWRDVLGDKYIADKVYIEHIPNVSGSFTKKNKKGEQYETTTSQSIATLLYYITKHVRFEDYTTSKHSEQENAMLLKSLHETIKGTTLVSSKGIFKDIISEYRVTEKDIKMEKKQQAEAMDNSNIFTNEPLRYNEREYVPYNDS